MYRDTGVVQLYRRSTYVQEKYRDKVVLHRYRSISGTGVVQGYRRSTEVPD
jgi:hypothetical protein